MKLVAGPNGRGAWGHIEQERTCLVSEPKILEGKFGDLSAERWCVFLLDTGPDYLSEVPPRV